MSFLYQYRARVVEVFDAETLGLDIDLGFHVHVYQAMKIAYVATPRAREGKHVEAIKAKEFVRGQLLGKPVFIRTVKPVDGSCRHRVEVWLDETGDHEFRECMIDAGHGRPCPQ